MTDRFFAISICGLSSFAELGVRLIEDCRFHIKATDRNEAKE